MIVLDTHAWVQLGLDPDRLSRRAHSAIRRQRHGVEISAFTLWETAWHVRRGHIQPKKPLQEWLPEFAAALQSRVHALSTEIVVQAAMLRGDVSVRSRRPPDHRDGDRAALSAGDGRREDPRSEGRRDDLVGGAAAVRRR